MSKYVRGFFSVITPAKGFTPTLRGLVHLEGIGDMLLHENAWAGTKGQSRRLEGFQLELAPSVEKLGMEYMAHLEGTGDTAWIAAGSFCGTRGQSRRLEGFAIRLTGDEKDAFDVFYQAHLEGAGDSAVASNGSFCGTRGQSRRCESIKIWVVAK